RLMSLFRSTATVLSPAGFGIAGSPAVSVSGVNVRPTPKPGSEVCSSAPPGTRSSLIPAAVAAETLAASRTAAIETLRARDKGHLRDGCLGREQRAVSSGEHEARRGSSRLVLDPCEIDPRRRGMADEVAS